MALSVQLGLLRAAGADATRRSAARCSAGLQARATTTLEDLRDLARGIYPPLLADQGLDAALAVTGAEGGGADDASTAGGVGRYPHDVEAAVYFSVLEAMNNVAKYADAVRAEITLAQRNGSLEFTVRDDGRGFDPAATTHGTGLQGIADRLDAIGGSMRVESVPGAGTTLIGVVSAEVIT